MPPVLIENPILNSPFREPQRHFRFDDNSITSDILNGRRPSEYFVPIAAPRKKSKQLSIESLIEPERKVEADGINRIRASVQTWRERGHPDVSATTRALLQHWTDPARYRRLFFCQIEALETLIFITEVAKQTKYGDTWIEESLRESAVAVSTPLLRMAFKMATGSGKTVVMAMMIAWHTLN